MQTKTSFEQSQTITAYTGPRGDVIGMIERPPVRVLDVGCSDGSLGEALKAVFPQADVCGVEIDGGFAATARGKLDTVFQVDLNDFNVETLPRNIDLFIFADVLEHTIEPKDVLKKLLDHCASEDPHVLVSVPNVQHWTVIKNLFIGVWPERDRGIFDRTHLRWFTLKSLDDLAAYCGMHVAKVRRNYRVIDRPGGRLNKCSRYLRFFPGKNIYTYQYVAALRRA